MSTKRDREKLRARIKTAATASKRTQKDVESAAGLPVGSLSRVYAGKKTADVELVTSLAKALSMPFDELAAGTSWAGDAPPAEASATVEEPPKAAKAPKAEAPKAEAAAAPPAKVEAPEAAPKVEAPAAPPAKGEAPKAAPKVEAPKAAPKIEPPPASEPAPRQRKRDLPFRLARALVDLILG